jgi:hypothetical protein
MFGSTRFDSSATAAALLRAFAASTSRRSLEATVSAADAALATRSAAENAVMIRMACNSKFNMQNANGDVACAGFAF